MAGEDNPFLTGIDDEENPFLKGVAVPEKSQATPMRTEPVTEAERMIFQNLFDNDAKRRNAYAKSIGLELDPDDENKFRALGSREEFTGEIDPGFGGAFKKGGLVEIAKELGRDTLGDMLVDYSTGGLAALAAGGGAVGGTAAGGPIGTAIGAILGGFGGAYAGEDVKEFIGNQLIDEDIPVSERQKLMVSTLGALGPVISKGIGRAAKGGLKTFLAVRQNAVKKALQQTGQLSDEAIEKAMKNPEMFDDAAVKGANEKFRKFYGGFFGVDPNDANAITKAVKEGAEGTPKGEFGKMLTPVYAARNKALSELETVRAADVSLGELKAPIERKITELTSKVSLTPDDKQAIGVLKDQLGEWNGLAKRLTPKGADGAAAKTATADNIRVSYGTAREFLQGLQGKAFDKATTSQNPMVNQTAGALRQSLDDRLTSPAVLEASRAGETFLGANKQISRAMTVYEDAAKTLTPEKMRQAFVLAPNSNRLDTLNTLAQMDEVLGADFAKQFEKGALQSQFEQFYSQAVPRGSSEVNAAIVKGVGKGVVKGGFGGAAVSGITAGAAPIAVTVPGGMLLGGVQGGLEAAALANPANALRKLSGIEAQGQFLDYIGRQGAQVAESLPGDSLRRAAVQQAGEEVLPTQEDEEENPFLKGL